MLIKYSQQKSFFHYWPGWQDQAEAWQALMVTSSKRGDEQKQETSFNLKMKKTKVDQYDPAFGFFVWST